MTIARAVLLAVALGGTADASAANAQEVPRSLRFPSQAARDSAVSRLGTGQDIRLAASSMGRITGKVGALAPDSLDLVQGDAVRRIPILAIDTLWTRGRATTTGLLVGGIVGGIVITGLAVLASGFCEYDCETSISDYVIVGFVGAAAGAGIGGIVGTAIPKWKLRFP